MGGVSRSARFSSSHFLPDLRKPFVTNQFRSKHKTMGDSSENLTMLYCLVIVTQQLEEPILNQIGKFPLSFGSASHLRKCESELHKRAHVWVCTKEEDARILDKSQAAQAHPVKQIQIQIQIVHNRTFNLIQQAIKNNGPHDFAYFERFPIPTGYAYRLC